MQYVPAKFYRYLHYVMVSISVIAALAYGAFYFLQPEILDALALTVITPAIATAHIIYALLVFPKVGRRSARNAAFLSTLIFTFNLVATIHLSGGFESPYFGLWLALIIAAGLLGTYVLVGSAFMISIYYIMTCAPQLTNGARANNCELVVGLSWVAATLSYFIWRRHWQDVSEVSYVKELSGQLSQEQLKSQILLQSIGDGVIIVNLEGKVQFLNRAAETITGWSETDGRNLDYRLILPMVDEEDQPLTDTADPFMAAFKNRQSDTRNDVILRGKTNKKNLSISVSPIINEGGTITGGIAVFRDISEEKRLERERSEFVSTASHEMRTPIAAMEGFLSLALNRNVSQLDENGRKYVKHAYDETQHLGTLFSDLLSVSKLEEERIPSNPQALEMNQVIQTVIEEQRFAADKKNLTLKYEVSNRNVSGEKAIKPLYYVYADPERLREVLSNLTDNAIKFTKEGGVRVTLTGDDNFVTIGVHDTGVGIDPADQKHLFQKFYRIDNSETRTVGGTGLGLYISRTIIEMYNGRMWVESQPGEGSHFYFSLLRLSYERAQQLSTQSQTQPNTANPPDAPTGANPVAQPTRSTSPAASQSAPTTQSE